MEILFACFGIAPTYFDITSRIKQDVINGVLTKTYTWRDLGDPCRGIEKELTIVFSHNGSIITRVFPEKSNKGDMLVNIP